MKTLTKMGVSVYVFEDEMTVNLEDNRVLVGDPIEDVILDCNSDNSVLYEGITPPEDWFGGKYNFDGAAWELNSDWEDFDLLMANLQSEKLERQYREVRNKLLAETDWWCLSDQTPTQAQLDYRQALRDITTHANWPNLTDADWPVKPS